MGVRQEISTSPIQLICFVILAKQMSKKAQILFSLYGVEELGALVHMQCVSH